MMAEKRQIYWLVFLLNSNLVFSTASKEDLESAEANGKLEIVKQIKKINEDGSYTIGYEADDGTFKIESRDVLGNVKGTYGYIDENGEIKRVSYSTNNSSEVISKPETPSVVQRIPKINKTSSTTRRPNILYHAVTTQNTPTSTTAVQSIPKRRVTTTAPPTTTDTKYSEFLKAAVEASKSTLNKQVIYEQSQPRILLQQRSAIRSDDIQKSEGQLIRPDVPGRPTEGPLYRRKATILENDQRLTGVGTEDKGNLLRRQLLPEKVSFDPKQHALNLQQSHGDDVVDVYSSSLTTGTPRPLFTTSRPQYISPTISTTIQRPTIKYAHYQNAKDQEYHQEASTENIQSTTPTPVPIVQIPPNRDMPETLVAIHHPVHGRTVLVPLNQLQNQNNFENIQFSEQYLRETSPPQQSIPLPIYVRQQPQKFKPIPVRVDENGYIREMPQYQSVTTPYSFPPRSSAMPIADYINGEEEINLIKPPVSTRDFQKLLEQLILRQSRLEQISHLTRRFDQMFGQRQRPIYRPGLMYQNKANEGTGMHYVDPQDYNLERQNLYNYQPFSSTSESYTPTRRVARLLSSRHLKSDDEDDDYLPPDVREMLLLRMLQLAINPALPLNIPENFDEGISLHLRHRKTGARNVEILGEEDDMKQMRSKSITDLINIIYQDFHFEILRNESI